MFFFFDLIKMSSLAETASHHAVRVVIIVVGTAAGELPV